MALGITGNFEIINFKYACIRGRLSKFDGSHGFLGSVDMQFQYVLSFAVCMTYGKNYSVSNQYSVQSVSCHQKTCFLI